MDTDNPRLKALFELKLGSVAYLEARDKHGESGAVAASADLFNKYHDTASSKEYIASIPKRASNYVPESGLDAENLDDFFKAPTCAGKFEACKSKEVNDADVRAFVKKSVQPKQSLAQGSKESQSLNSSIKAFDQNIAHLKKNVDQTVQPHGSNDFEINRSSNAQQNKVQSIFPKAAEQPKSSLLDQINNNLSKRVSAPTSFSNEVPMKKARQQQPVAAQPTNSPEEDPSGKSHLYPDFKSSSTEYLIQQASKRSAHSVQPRYQAPPPPQIKRLGRHPINAPFKSPFIQQSAPAGDEPMQIDSDAGEIADPLLKGIEPKLLEVIKSEIVSSGKPVKWEDIAGLEKVKQSIQEAVELPLMYPWMFAQEGLLKMEKGILLFGPPGTGKTLIAKCVSSQSQATFFSISASTLTSKWIGEGEKLVKALFAYARYKQPSVIFIDEIDSILTKRGDNDHESSTRLKTEFMVQIDGASSTAEEDRILVIGATNRPHKLDEAIIRRFSKRFYVPLPDLESRAQLLTNLLRKESHNLTAENILLIASKTEGYSGDDMKRVGSQAAMYRIRELCAQRIAIERDMMRPVTFDDFLNSLREVKATVGQEDLQLYTDWSKKVGSN